MAKKRLDDKLIEQTVIGTAMRDAKVFEAVAKIIRKPEVFVVYAHQRVWAALVRMHREALPFDPVTVSDTLTRMKAGDDCRPDYIIELWERASSLDVSHHAKTLVDLHLKRAVYRTMQELGDELGEADVSPIALLEKAKKEFEAVAALGYQDAGGEESEGRSKFSPFPIDLLPTSLQDFVFAGSEALYCDPAFLAVPSIAVIAAAIGNSREIRVKETWPEPSIVWAAVIADSSSMKSPTMDLAVSPLWAIQKRMSLEYEDAYKSYRRSLDEWTNQRFDRFRKDKDEDCEPKPEKPKPRKLVVSDITIEKLACVLWENPQGVVLCRDELSGWFQSFGRYSSNSGPGADLSNWLELFRASHLQIDRKSGDPPSIHIPRASCSVIGTIQPKVMKNVLTDQFFDSGLTSRMLFCMPPRRAKVWTEAIVPESVYDGYAGTIRNLYECGQDFLEISGKRPKPITFNKAGKNAWIEFYSEWSDRQNNSSGEHAYALAKLEAYCGRFCLLLQSYEKMENSFRKDEITEGQVRRAFGLVQWFSNEADRVYSMVREPAEQHARDKLVEFIRAIGGEITPRRLVRSNPSKYVTSENATKILDSLVEQKLGTWKTIPPQAAGGPSARVFVVSPDKTCT